MRAVTLFAFVIALVASHQAMAGNFEPGNWKLTYLTGPGEDTVEFIAKIEPTNGKLSATMVGANPKGGVTAITSAALVGKDIVVAVDRTGTEYTFIGATNGTKAILGSYGAADRLRPAKLTWTEENKLDKDNAIVRREAHKGLKTVFDVRNEATKLRRKLVQANEEEAKAIRDQLQRSQREWNALQYVSLVFAKVESQQPFDQMEVLLSRLRLQSTQNEEPEFARLNALSALAVAKQFGQRYYREMLLQVGELLAQDPNYAKAALDVSERAEKELADDTSASRRVRYLTVQATALEQLKDAKRAKAVGVELEAAELALDAAFLTALPKVESKPYAGRKNPAGRTVLMELFTGTECPPCAAADYGFDLLQDAYRPTELIQLQYHLHIPSPDPLTNPDSEARWEYYVRAFPKDAQGTPTPVFSGSPQMDDGGSLAMTGQRLKGYREAIDKRLEESADARIALDVARKGDRLTIRSKVTDVKQPGQNVRLRFALVESNVRFQGSNGFRYHHNVVRAMPGGAAGFPITTATTEREVVVDLAALRTGLNKYLDDFARDRLAFPKPQRPMALKKLKVVAFVQDDATHAITQAMQVDVPEAD